MTTTPNTDHYSTSEARADSDANNPDAYDDEYLVIVTFRRSISEDWGIAETNGYAAGKEVAEALKRQIVAELQEACENGLAGFFEVESVKLTPKAATD